MIQCIVYPGTVGSMYQQCTIHFNFEMLVRLLEGNYPSFAKPFIRCIHNVEEKVFVTQHTVGG